MDSIHGFKAVHYCICMNMLRSHSCIAILEHVQISELSEEMLMQMNSKVSKFLNHGESFRTNFVCIDFFLVYVMKIALKNLKDIFKELLPVSQMSYRHSSGMRG